MFRLPSSQVVLLFTTSCALALLSCAKPAADAQALPSATVTVPEASVPAATTPASTVPETKVAAPAAEVAETVLPMKTVTAEPASKPVKTSPASSLGGQDRHLVLRPLDVIHARDFELGPLLLQISLKDPSESEQSPKGLSGALEMLASGLGQGTLPLDIFETSMATVAKLLYAEALEYVSHIDEVRFQEPVTAPGGAVSVGLRLITMIDNERRSASGLAILTEHDSQMWRIEHLELDLGALELENPGDRGTYDPYAQSYSGNQGD